MLEIKGADGDKIMILQFDNRQLQVFNEILEKQMQHSKDEGGTSILSSSLDGGNSEEKKRSKVVAITPEPTDPRLETEPTNAAQLGSGNLHAHKSFNSGTTSGDELKKKTSRDEAEKISDRASRLKNLKAKAH